MATKFIIISLYLLIIFILMECMNCCLTDCSTQAGAPCDVISSSLSCPTREVGSEPYPDQLTTINIYPILHGTTPVGLNVTWTYVENNGGRIKGYELEYWSYTGKVIDGPNSMLDTCLRYNFTSNQRPNNGSSFYGNCATGPNRTIKISVQPQRDPLRDYIHRITQAYEQDYGENTAKWSPELMIIHNDSCNREVQVEFYLPPKEFHFNHFIVVLESTNETHFEKDVFTNPNDVTAKVNFYHVWDGDYRVVLLPEPYNDEKCKCITVYCEYDGCYTTPTHIFIVQADHVKCPEKVTTTENPTSEIPVDIPSDNPLHIIIIILPILLIIMIIISIWIIAVTCCKQKIEYIKTIIGKLFSQNKVPPQDPRDIEIRNYSGENASENQQSDQDNDTQQLNSCKLLDSDDVQPPLAESYYDTCFQNNDLNELIINSNKSQEELLNTYHSTVTDSGLRCSYNSIINNNTSLSYIIPMGKAYETEEGSL